MTLNETQIQQLFDFTRQHYVEYYDVQAELVDHLANAIEERMTENPKLTFDQALDAEFKKFGIFGFMDVVGHRKAALNKKYNKMVWTHFVEFFRIPKILLSIAAVVSVFYFLKWITMRDAAFIALLALITVVLFVKMTVVSVRSRRKIKAEKRWLFEEIIFRYGSVTSFMFFPIQLISHFYNNQRVFTSDISVWIESALIVAYAMFGYVILYEIPSKAHQYLSKMYPEYSVAES